MFCDAHKSSMPNYAAMAIIMKTSKFELFFQLQCIHMPRRWYRADIIQIDSFH